MHGFLQDARHSFRGLREAPALFAAAVVCLGLGIGATSVLVGFLDALLLRPPAQVQNPEQIVRLSFSHELAAEASPWTSFPVYQLLHRRMTGLSGMGAYASRTVEIGQGADSGNATAELVTTSYFSVLGVEPITGRFFGADDELAFPPSTVVVSHGFWQGRFGGANDVLDMSVYIGGRAFAVVGVAPPGFSGIDKTRVDLWIPIGVASELVHPDALSSPTRYWVSLFGRSARTERALVGEEATTILRSSQALRGLQGDARVVPGSVLAERGAGWSAERRLSTWLAVSSAMLLLIACANTANLMLVRLLGRTQELATRAALGATKGRLTQQAACECGIVAALGGIVAAIVVRWTGASARALLAPSLELAGSNVDLRTALQVGLLTLIAGVLCSLPAIVFVATTRQSLDARIQPAARSLFQRSAGSVLVVGQCAATVALLIGMGLFGRSLTNITNLDLGIDTEHVVYASADFRMKMSRADTIAMYKAMSERVEAVQGVRTVSMAMGLPLRRVWAVALTLPDEVWLGPNPVALGREVDANFFVATGLRITRGRPFDTSEHTPPARVAIINEAFARAFWRTETPLGACLLLGGDELCTKVVGVAANTPRWNIAADREYEVYIPIDEIDGFGVTSSLGLAVRTSVDPGSLVPSIRTAIQSVSPHIVYAAVAPVSEIVAPQVRPWRIGTGLFSMFGILGVILSSVGQYSLLAFFVTRDKPTMGIRMALGASPFMIRRSVTARGVGLCAIGATIGLLAASTLAPAAESLLFGISARDPFVFVGSAGVVLATAVAASYLPGRRAAGFCCAALLRGE